VEGVEPDKITDPETVLAMVKVERLQRGGGGQDKSLTVRRPHDPAEVANSNAGPCDDPGPYN
jgi:hypothetical protein